MRETKHIFEHIDRVTVVLYLILVLAGWLNIYAAVYNDEHRFIFDFSQKYGKQMIWILCAFVLAIIILAIDGKFFSAFSYPIYVLFILSLILVMLVGVEVNASRSWFQIGEFRIQPAEFAKFATSLALANYLSQVNTKIEDLKTKIIVAFIILLPVGIILLQNDTGSALVYFALIFMLYREGLSGNWLIIGLVLIVLFLLSLIINKYYLMGAVTLVFAFLFYLVKKRRREIITLISIFLLTQGFIFGVSYMYTKVLQSHQKERIDVLLGKDVDLKGPGYNLNQSKIAIGSGGLWGKGFLKGTQTKFDFVPEQSTDFIFCTIGEEWGFVGSTIIIALFVVLLIRLINMAERQRSAFSRIYGYCVASILFFHITINIGMTIGLFPVIGIPLPFFSYGGSSLWSFTILLFIFVKLDAYRMQLL
ncbi:MAG: Rod shape-determining protein RodA [Bacteroidetes bacterium ADurb.Bin408]|nr:MAG: Rod shape-determining protein RodA [Bacteroidetes bacterium ADurb.Bin408]